MSDTIQITILQQDAGSGSDMRPESQREINVTHDTSETLMSTLLKNQLVCGDFCGGTGKCQRCRVRFLEAAPLPTNTERIVFTPDELRKGYRLACMARPKNSCVICLDFIQSRKMDIITDMMVLSEKVDCKGQIGYIIAVDLGTTTIAMQLMDLESGHVLDTYCVLNPQRRYGADVLSRIQAANTGAAENLRDSVWEVLRAGAEKLYQAVRCAHPLHCMCIAGNTTMEHLLMGLSTETLGRSPFTPVEIGFQESFLRIPSMADQPLPVYLVPGISTFVGGDIVAGLYCCHLLASQDFLSPQHDQIGQGMQPLHESRQQENQRQESRQQENQRQESRQQESQWQESRPQDYRQNQRSQQSEPGATLFIDLGTNGEMAITDGRRMIVTATAAGPAFEGGAGASVHGSDMIAITASLLEQGIIDGTGLLQEPYFTSGVTVPVPGAKETVHLKQKDIRDLQMAKAAVRAGVEILYEKMRCPVISRVYLAGGFGYYLNVEAAITIGLLPEHVREATKAVGNTSLAGAFMIGRDLIMQHLHKEALERCLGYIESLNLAGQEGFEQLYLTNLHLRLC